MADRKSFLLRMDPALWAEIEGWAQDEMRSVNGQIEYLLKAAIQKRKGSKPAGDSKEKKPPPQTEHS